MTVYKIIEFRLIIIDQPLPHFKNPRLTTYCTYFPNSHEKISFVVRIEKFIFLLFTTEFVLFDEKNNIHFSSLHEAFFFVSKVF